MNIVFQKLVDDLWHVYDDENTDRSIYGVGCSKEEALRNFTAWNEVFNQVKEGQSCDIIH